MQSMVRAMHQAEHGESANEVRHALRPRATKVHRDVGDDSNSKNWLSRPTSLWTFRGQIQISGFHASAQRRTQQGTLSYHFGQSCAQGRASPVSTWPHQSIPERIFGEDFGVQ